MSTSPLESNPELQRLAIDLLVTSARFTRLVARESPRVIPHALWRALAELEELGPARVNDLAAADRVSQPTATMLIQKLVEHGWVERNRDPDDGRAVRASVTDAGRAALAHAREAAADSLLPRLSRLDGETLHALDAGVNALSTMMEAKSATGTDPRMT